MRVTDEQLDRLWRIRETLTDFADIAALELAISALSHAAGQEVVVPEGWALVPKGASVAMCEAGAKHLADYGLGTAWADMIDAAPIAPAPASTSAEVGRDGEQCRAASVLTADMAKALPNGTMDDSTFQAVEDALDAIEAPITGPDGRWLTLPQRIRAISRGVPEGE